MRNKCSVCGHKEAVSSLPRTNCQLCWNDFFINHNMFTTKCVEIVINQGHQELEKLQGTKLVKFFRKFAETHAFKEIAIPNEQPQ